MNNKIILSFFTLSLCLYLNSIELIVGDKDAPEGQTFSFSVNKNLMSSTGIFYEGALTNIDHSKDYALSQLMPGARAFMPIAPEKVTINNTADLPNPLFGAGIIALSSLEIEQGLFIRDLPLVVTKNIPTTVYLLENLDSTPDKITMVAAENVRDAQRNVSNGVINMTTNFSDSAFAAVKPHGGQFGDPFSGIALLQRGTQETKITKDGKEETKKQLVFGQVNAYTASTADPQAFLLDATSPTLNIQSTALQNIVQNAVALHWDNALKLLFVGLQVTANSNPGDGARAVVVFSFVEKAGLKIFPIAPDSAFDDGNTNNIIGVRGAGQQVSIHAIKTLFTSTALDYLIIVGGNGDPASTQQIVSALPLVSDKENKGVIAQKNAIPENSFENTTIPRFAGRIINQAATTQEEMPQITDTAVQVGGGPLTAGPIVNIITRDDTIFAFVGDNAGTNNPGVYSSQAIFDQSGKITSWTAWQRAAGTTEQIFGCALQASAGNFILATGDTQDTVNTIQRTSWSNGSPSGLQPLTTILNNTFPASHGGIQSLQTFLPHSPGLQNISTLVAGGIGNVLITQTGELNNNNIIMPTAATTDNTIIIADDALKNIGPITAMEFANNVTNGWLFVGGSNGLAILANDNGSGWDATTQLGTNLDGLTDSMHFHQIGNYSFVQQLVYDDNFLYVITHDKVDRIDLSPTNFDFNNFNPITIATARISGITSSGNFLHGIFSQACGILATTNGLIRIGDNKDARTIINENDAHWTNIAIPENAGAPTALYAVTSTNRAQDITHNNGGFFYVLTSNVGINQSRINRFAVQPLAADAPMNAQTIQPFDDLFVKNIPSFLLSFGQFRSNFATDGALYFATRNQDGIFPPKVMLTPSAPVPMVGMRNVGDLSQPVRINLQNGTEINAFERSQASGSWIIAGNFDTQVLE